MDRAWSAKASRPFDPYLTEHGVEQVSGGVDTSNTLCNLAITLKHGTLVRDVAHDRPHYAQARAVAAQLKEFDIKQICTSPFLRCVITTLSKCRLS